MYLIGEKKGEICDLIGKYNKRIRLPAGGVVFVSEYCPINCNDITKVILSGPCGVSDEIDDKDIIKELLVCK